MQNALPLPLEIITAQEARLRGLNRYFTGKPCKHGHISPRHLDGACSACRAEGVRRWHEMHPESKKKSARKRYWGNREAELERSKAWGKVNKDKKLVAVKRSQRNNRERYLENRRRSHQNCRDRELEKCRLYNKENAKTRGAYAAAYFKRNRDVILAAKKRWRQENPHKQAQYDRQRKRAIAQATPRWVDVEKIKRIYKDAARAGLSVDHIVPLQSKHVCGLHVHDNLQPLPLAENVAKLNSRWPDMP
jgi:hypothetical protein